MELGRIAQEVAGADVAHALKQFQLAPVPASASAYSFVDPFLCVAAHIGQHLAHILWHPHTTPSTRRAASTLIVAKG